MECPKCESTESQVTDSKLMKDENIIRRRRKCLACSNRFTTYEATEDHLLSLLIQGDARRDARDNLSTMLLFIAKTLDSLSDETEKLNAKMDRPEKSQPEKSQDEKSQAKKSQVKKSQPEKKIKETPIKKVKPAEKPARKRVISRKTAGSTGSETVLGIIKKHKKGIDVSQLKAKTGFNDKKIRNIVHRASKQGKIKRIGRGLYVMA